MNKKEEQAAILKKYDSKIISLYQKILNEEKNFSKENEYKKKVHELILEEAK